MRARLLFAVVLALALPLLVAACGGDDAEPELPTSVVRLGAVPGPTAWDAEVLNGVRAAVRELERRGGVDEKVRLRLHVGTPGRLLRSGVRLLVLPCDARTQAASAAAARRRDAFVLEPCNTGIWRRFPDVWPVSVSPADEARVLAGYLDDEGYERVAVLGEGKIGLAVRAAVEEEGLAVTPIRRADVVAVAVGAPFAAPTIARLRLRGVQLPGRVDTRPRRPPFDPPRPRGPRRRRLHHLRLPEPGSELDELAERYRALTGRRPDSSVAALGYDAVRVLEFAMVASPPRRSPTCSRPPCAGSRSSARRQDRLPGAGRTQPRRQRCRRAGGERAARSCSTGWTSERGHAPRLRRRHRRQRHQLARRRRAARERGWRVAVLERNDYLGGAIKTAEITEPGFRHDVFSAWHPLWSGGAAHAMLGDDLASRGLEYLNTDLPDGYGLPGRRERVPPPEHGRERGRARPARGRGRRGVAARGRGVHAERRPLVRRSLDGAVLVGRPEPRDAGLSAIRRAGPAPVRRGDARRRRATG